MSLVSRSLISVVAALLFVPAMAVDIPVPAAPKIAAQGYYLMDFESGNILAEQEAEAALEPASLTKLMTAYVVFQQIGDQIQLNDSVTISEKAWRTPGSRMFVEVDTQVTVEELLKGMIIQSGNDASVALAEHVAGTEDTFAQLMNQYADSLGMTSTNFLNSTGLPAEGHVTSARDIAILTRAMIAEFPELYAWYAEREYTYNDIRQHNRNTLLWRDNSVDGVKTGHTDSAGYCLVASAKRGDMRLISVVMGTPSEKSRADASQAILNYGFRFFETHRLYAAGDEITSTRVWKSAAEQEPFGLTEDLYVTIPRGSYQSLEAEMDLVTDLTAPLSQHATVGAVRISLNGELLATKPLVALNAIEQGSIWQRAKDQVLMWIE